MRKQQPTDQPVDVTRWSTDEEFPIYPEGSRDKSALISPSCNSSPFLIASHRYLYKHSIKRHPEQYWGEIIAYHVGLMMNIDVPPTFVAVDRDNQTDGALIEWFYGYKGETAHYTKGGAFMTDVIKDFDEEKGTQHNFRTISMLCSVFTSSRKLDKNWYEHWVKVLLFDALIGNTDRHQDNWGLIELYAKGKHEKSKLSPAFDNGTSMGYEILDMNIKGFLEDDAKLNRYISKGCPHMKWSIRDERRLSHEKFLMLLCRDRKGSKDIMTNYLLRLDVKRLKDVLLGFCEFDVPHPLTEQRVQFISKLISRRKERLTSSLQEIT